MLNLIKVAFLSLKGKKSYIVAGLMIVLGLLNGDSSLLLEGLAVFSLRNAIQ